MKNVEDRTKMGRDCESLFRRAIEAPHKRLRERYLALALIALGEPAIKVAKKLGRNQGTIEAWVHKFNALGLDGIEPNWKGNPGTILSEEELEQLRNAVKKSPREVGFKNGRWTGRLVADFVYERFGKKISIRTAIRYLHRLGFKLKRARKKSKKQTLKSRKDSQKIYKSSNRSPRSVTVYVDEGQIWCDASLGRIWSPIGAEVESTSPSKKENILFYTAVVRPMEKVITINCFNPKNPGQNSFPVLTQKFKR